VNSQRDLYPEGINRLQAEESFMWNEMRILKAMRYFWTNADVMDNHYTLNFSPKKYDLCVRYEIYYNSMKYKYYIK
jgi:hypothetical protein